MVRKGVTKMKKERQQQIVKKVKLWYDMNVRYRNENISAFKAAENLVDILQTVYEGEELSFAYDCMNDIMRKEIENG
mgnify:CR=1 FL=1